MAHLPWKLARDGNNLMEERLSCVIVPRGYSGEYAIRRMTSERGNLSTHQYIVLFTVYFKYLTLQLLDPTYRAAFVQLCDDMVQLLSPSLVVERLQHTFDMVCETISLIEGLLPESVLTFVLHEMVDISASLRQFGPIRSWSMFNYKQFGSASCRARVCK